MAAIAARMWGILRGKPHKVRRLVRPPHIRKQCRYYRLNGLRHRCRNIIALVRGVHDALENDRELRVVVRLTGSGAPESSVGQESLSIAQSHIFSLQCAHGVFDATPARQRQLRAALRQGIPAGMQCLFQGNKRLAPGLMIDFRRSHVRDCIAVGHSVFARTTARRTPGEGEETLENARITTEPTDTCDFSRHDVDRFVGMRMVDGGTKGRDD